LLDQEHCVLEHWVVEQVLRAILLYNELSKINHNVYIMNERERKMLTGICFGRGGGASRMTIGACSGGGGG
jgi:hypothetical protein